MERLRGVFHGRTDVVVPTLFADLTAAGVLTMSFEEGLKINDIDGQRAQGIDPEAVGKLLVESYFEMLLRHRVFHAYPHPGRFLGAPRPDAGRARLRRGRGR